MSQSSDPEYLQIWGVVGKDGPLDGKVIDDGALLMRNVAWPPTRPDGYYRLRGKRNGSLFYQWDPA